MSTTIETSAPQQPANGLLTYLSVISSPTDAFQQLARTPMWGWAAIAGIILTIVATIIMLPEQTHLGHIMQAQSLQQMTAEQQAQAAPAMAKIEPFLKYTYIAAAVIQPWVGWLIAGAVFSIAAALGGGEAKFRSAWVLAVNAYAITTIALLVNAIILAMRGPDSVNTPLDTFVVPSLAMLVHGNPKLEVFLYAYNIIYVWAYIVMGIGLVQVMKMSRTASIVTVIILSLLLAGIGMLFAK